MGAFLIVSKGLLADKTVSTTAKLLFAQLCDHRNRGTGQCNPRRRKLAEELGVSIPTVSRALTELRKVGLIQSTKGRYTNSYEIQSYQIRSAGGGPVGSNSIGQSDQIRSAGGPTPLYEPYQGEPTRVRAEALPRRGPPREQSPNTAPAFPGLPRKDAGREPFWDPLRGKFLTKTQYDQLTLAMALENHRRKYGA